jgi:hypothetical protein
LEKLGWERVSSSAGSGSKAHGGDWEQELRGRVRIKKKDLEGLHLNKGKVST